MILRAAPQARLFATPAFMERFRADYLPGFSEERTVVLDAPEGDYPALLRAVASVLEGEATPVEVFAVGLNDLWKPMLKAALRRRNPIGPNGRLSGIWSAANFHYMPRFNRRRVVSEWILRLIIRNTLRFPGQHLFFFNEDLHQWAADRYDRQCRALRWCPDPPADLPGPTVVSGVADRPVLLMTGHHKPRKGTGWALHALRNWTGRPIEVVVAGEVMDLDLPSLVRALPPQVTATVMDRWIGESELEQLYAASTAVLLPYRHFGGSSGIFVNAIARGKPVILPDYGVLAGRVRQVGCGVTFEHDSEQAFLQCIERVLADPAAHFDGEKVRAFLDRNSPASYVAAVLQANAETASLVIEPRPTSSHT